ncbi:hypothetical protein BC374_01335 [Ensifer sp. LC13]|nr:hypothetical protein BC374_01335 [Ensifer sp. LC13]OCP13967.1 hypothetical protein BC362_04270 [Ensifer sp. LC14]OCP32493.1 hypothetical protein BC364_01335 [Ensifer sp. LC499]
MYRTASGSDLIRWIELQSLLMALREQDLASLRRRHGIGGICRGRFLLLLEADTTARAFVPVCLRIFRSVGERLTPPYVQNA